MNEVDFLFSRPLSCSTSFYLYEVERGTRSVLASFERALNELRTRNEVGQRNNETSLFVVAGSVAARSPQSPRARASEAPDAVPGQAPKSAGQRRYVNAMSTEKRHDASR